MIEKEYYQYLNQVKSECDIASAGNKELSLAMFEKTASPYHYWKESQLLKPGEQPKPELCTAKQIETINKFLDHNESYYEEITDKYKYNGRIEEMPKDLASQILSDWIARIKK